MGRVRRNRRADRRSGAVHEKSETHGGGSLLKSSEILQKIPMCVHYFADPPEDDSHFIVLKKIVVTAKELKVLAAMVLKMLQTPKSISRSFKNVKTSYAVYEKDVQRAVLEKCCKNGLTEEAGEHIVYVLDLCLLTFLDEGAIDAVGTDENKLLLVNRESLAARGGIDFAPDDNRDTRELYVCAHPAIVEVEENGEDVVDVTDDQEDVENTEESDEQPDARTTEHETGTSDSEQNATDVEKESEDHTARALSESAGKKEEAIVSTARSFRRGHAVRNIALKLLAGTEWTFQNIPLDNMLSMIRESLGSELSNKIRFDVTPPSHLPAEERWRHFDELFRDLIRLYCGKEVSTEDANNVFVHCAAVGKRGTKVHLLPQFVELLDGRPWPPQLPSDDFLSNLGCTRRKKQI